MAVINNTEKHRYELDTDGQITFADYKRDGKTLTIMHVEAPLSLRGAGVAGQLMQGMLDQARSEGLKVVPVCSYAAMWIQRHKDYHDLLQ